VHNKPYPLYEVEPLCDLKELLNRTAEKYGDRTAFIYERKGETIQVSYRQFKSDVEALGTTLFNMGIKNMKVGLISENSYEWILTYFAVANSGNVIVPLDKELPTTEVKNLMDHSGAQVFVYSATYADVSAYLRENGAGIKHFISADSLRELVEKGDLLIQRGEKSVVDYKVDNTALAALSYTSGTTGNPKGVMLSHSNIAKNAVAICQNTFFPDSGFLVLPLHHAAGFMGVWCMLIYGTTVAINQGLKTLQSDFMKYKPRIIVLVPLFVETFYKQIISAYKKQNEKVSLTEIAKQVFGGELSIIICGGAPLDGKYVDGYLDMGIKVLNIYGLTETSGVIAFNRNHYFRAESVGQIIPNCEVIISNPDEKGHGEIFAKGSHIMLGYYKNEQATAETFDGEWLKTGDIGYMDEDGFLYISGRKKNMIILSNGENVYPEEVEFALLKHIPYIKEAVVYAGDDEIIAEVFLDTENHPDCAARLDKDILAFNETQAAYKNINRTIIRDTEFPKTTTKKIKRQYK
jgi:long-chain acyl-CoA synthetase